MSICSVRERRPAGRERLHGVKDQPGLLRDQPEDRDGIPDSRQDEQRQQHPQRPRPPPLGLATLGARVLRRTPDHRRYDLLPLSVMGSRLWHAGQKRRPGSPARIVSYRGVLLARQARPGRYGKLAQPNDQTVHRPGNDRVTEGDGVLPAAILDRDLVGAQIREAARRRDARGQLEESRFLDELFQRGTILPRERLDVDRARARRGQGRIRPRRSSERIRASHSSLSDRYGPAVINDGASRTVQAATSSGDRQSARPVQLIPRGRNSRRNHGSKQCASVAGRRGGGCDADGGMRGNRPGRDHGGQGEAGCG